MDRPYRTVRDLVHAHAGQPAVVLGGGLSLPEELPNCPPRGEAIYLSANDHGARLVECDYLVAHDRIEDRLRPFGKPIVSRHMWADYRYMMAPVASTGVITAWVARILGCSPIFIAGMDCYSREGTYHDRPDAVSNGFDLPVDTHVGRWRSMCERFPADYRPLGGPLAAAMPSWDIVRVGIAPRAQLLEEVAGVYVRFLQRTLHRGRWFERNERVELQPLEIVKMLERGQVERA